jgi:hypothetical protein
MEASVQANLVTGSENKREVILDKKLARKFRKGFGGPVNTAEAIRWYTKAVNVGVVGFRG